MQDRETGSPLNRSAAFFDKTFALLRTRFGHEPSPIEQRFIKTLLDQGLPSDMQRNAEQFASYITKHNPPEGLLDRLARTYLFVAPETIQTYFDEMAVRLKEIIGSNDYCYVAPSGNPDTSNIWVLKNMVRRGVTIPKRFINGSLFSTHASLTVGDTEIPLYEYPDSDMAEDELLFIACDDGSFNGMQLSAMTMFVPHHKQLHIILIYATEVAQKRIKEVFPHAIIECIRSQPIISLNEALYPEDIAFFDRILDDANASGYKFGHSKKEITLLGTRHRIPDNTPFLFAHGLETRTRRERVKYILPPLFPSSVRMYTEK